MAQSPSHIWLDIGSPISHINLPQNRRYKQYLRMCRRCAELFKGTGRDTKICPCCMKPKGMKKGIKWKKNVKFKVVGK